MSNTAHLTLGDVDHALLAALPVTAWDANGVPPAALAARRRLALDVAQEVVADLLRDDGIRYSPLGVEWSSDLDLHVRSLPSLSRLVDAGWLPLDDLLRQVGRRGSGRWAVRGGGGPVLAMADLDLGPRPRAIDRVLERARRRGEVRVREILELRVLQRGVDALPVDDPVVVAAARGEQALGGTELSSAVGNIGGSVIPPVPIDVVRPPRNLKVVRRPRALRRRFVVAFSGVDGSGKSTLARALAEELSAAGIEVSQVWARPGMRLRVLDRIARIARRGLGQGSEPAMQRVAKGLPVASPSRRGAVGWAWALLITVSFVIDVWRRHLSTAGVVLYDRHAIDAEVTLAFVYRGVDLRFHHWLVRTVLPRADVAVYLEIGADEAASRKPQDTFGAHAIRAQLEEYARLLPDRPQIRRLDTGTDVAALVAAMLELVAVEHFGHS